MRCVMSSGVEADDVPCPGPHPVLRRFVVLPVVGEADHRRPGKHCSAERRPTEPYIFGLLGQMVIVGEVKVCTDMCEDGISSGSQFRVWFRYSVSISVRHSRGMHCTGSRRKRQSVNLEGSSNEGPRLEDSDAVQAVSKG